MRPTVIKLLLLSVLITLFSSCEEKLCGCTVIDADVNIVITDSDNRNLLDPSTPGHFNKEDIRIYFVRNGQRQEAYAPNLDAARYFSINQTTDDNGFVMKLLPDLETRDSDITTTIIKWNETEEDVVTCEVRHSDNTTIITKVWYNDELGYDQNDTQGPRLIKAQR